MGKKIKACFIFGKLIHVVLIKLVKRVTRSKEFNYEVR